MNLATMHDPAAIYDRERAIHHAATLLSEHLHLTEEGLIEAIAVVATAVAYDVDIAMHNGLDTLPCMLEDHVSYLLWESGLSIDPDASGSLEYLDDPTWCEATAEYLLANHWIALDRVVQALSTGRPEHAEITAMLQHRESSNWAEDRNAPCPW